MRLKLLLPILLLCNSLLSYAQKPYYNQRPEFLKANSVWAFGNKAGLDFNSGTPVAIHTSMRSDEGGTSVADPVTGKLLFYSNGGWVWNAKHQIMPNGDSLLGNGAGFTSIEEIQAYSTAQGVCVVPVIGTSDQYYLFSLSGYTSGGPKPPTNQSSGGTLFFNVVDMSLDNGLGDIPAGKKNIVLNSGDILSESMIAIPGNNCDVWLLVYKYGPPEEYMAYHITKDGIDTVPVLSSSLPPLTPKIRPQLARSRTFMAVSPDRSKIAMANFYVPYGTMIGEFDPNTGQVNNLIPISDNYLDTNNVVVGYGICFSPDGSKLYIGNYLFSDQQFKTAIPNGVRKKSPAMYQYDLSAYSSTAISNSMQSIGFIPTTDTPNSFNFGGQKFGGMTLYNDTIYAVSVAFAFSGLNTYIHRINQPNLRGTACGFQANAISLLPGDSTMLGLHSDVVFPLYDTVATLALDTTICFNENLILKPVDNYQLQYVWDDSTTEDNRIINKAGVYWVIQSDGCHTYIDTFIVEGFDFPEPIININVLELGLAGSYSYSSYQWLLNGNVIPGATGRTYTVSENGDYQVVVSNEYSCTDTSEVYKVTNVTGINSISGLEQEIKIYPNPVNDLIHVHSPVAIDIRITSIEGKLIKKVSNAKAIDVKGWAEGVYLIHVYNQEGILLRVVKFIKSI